jgi:hypothetical protein
MIYDFLSDTFCHSALDAESILKLKTFNIIEIKVTLEKLQFVIASISEAICLFHSKIVL